MTRKDYEMIADCIAAERAAWESQTEALAGIDRLTDRITRALQKDNPRFNAGKFRRRCLNVKT
mgnify:CR=1 FL=1